MPGTPSLSTAEVAQLVGGRLEGPPDRLITGMQVVDVASAEELTYIGSSRYARLWAESSAGAALVAPQVPLEADGRALIHVEDVDHALAKVLEAFAPPPPQPPEGIDPTTVIAESAEIGTGARIGPQCVIGPGVSLGPRAVLHGQVTIMAHTHIGSDAQFWPGVVVRERCRIADRCTLHSNASIGTDGFGFRMGSDGRSVVKIPQIGTVNIGHDVEIGANSCVDRGKFGSTEIGDSTKIDNLSQIGHNARIGRCVIIAGCAAIGGSVRIGDGALLGGHVGAADHVNIGPGARIGGGSVVLSDVPAGKSFFWYPADEGWAVKKRLVLLRKLPELVKSLKQS
ncbi:MAG: UDP-3-O-(3-hydroxymyristoyl)glucosamine N-acyltransferase [Phycisphaeraceae bacterium]|nr:UDP-3-O-(3-hydroxymyristoyl)glucosamine N-acyltransferase [Phycisphaeraceae bacterium]